MIELRWFEKTLVLENRDTGERIYSKQPRVLQYRQHYLQSEWTDADGASQKAYAWSNWQDVPVVSDVPTERG